MGPGTTNNRVEEEQRKWEESKTIFSCKSNWATAALCTEHRKDWGETRQIQAKEVEIVLDLKMEIFSDIQLATSKKKKKKIIRCTNLELLAEIWTEDTYWSPLHISEL